MSSTSTTAELTVADTGRYFIRVSAVSVLVESGRPSEAQFVDVVTDLTSSGDDPSTAPLVGFGTGANDSLTALNVFPIGDTDWFAIDACRSDTITVETLAGRLTPPSDVDTYLELRDVTGGTVIDSNDDAIGTDSRIEMELPSNGRYHAIVGGSANTVGRYDISFEVGPGPANTGSQCIEAPAITNYSPRRAPRGFSPVTIDGMNFTDAEVTFDGVVAPVLAGSSDTRIITSVPTEEDGLNPNPDGRLRVSNAGGYAEVSFEIQP
ncbi:MAG: hypothetical protein GWM93_01470 [Gemmatimonadetes bacterium]|nr:hypothetical protein [Gemmatimonadota bacterium]NIY33929.1 hypothetical protein [Gemmatimonadota bacterium]NIY42198.1 hypothetical protein [Gemmatimonadota bacterium]